MVPMHNIRFTNLPSLEKTLKCFLQKTRWSVLRNWYLGSIIFMAVLQPDFSHSTEMKIAGGPPGTMYSVFCQELSAYLNSRFSPEYHFSPVETQGSMENIDLLMLEHDVTIGLAQEDVGHFFYTGENNPFYRVSRRDDPRVACLGRLFYESLFFVTRRDIPFSKLKRVHVGKTRSGIFATYFSYSSQQNPIWEETHEGLGLDQLEAGNVDGYFDVDTPFSQTLNGIDNFNDKYRLVPVKRTQLSLGLDIYGSAVIPDSLNPSGQNVESVSIPALIFCKRNLPVSVGDAILEIFLDEAKRDLNFPLSKPFLSQIPNSPSGNEGATELNEHFRRLPLPPHPSLVLHLTGKNPLFGFILAVIIIFSIVWITYLALYRWRLTRFLRATRNEIFAVLSVILIHSILLLILKMLEINSLTSGAVTTGSVFTQMNFVQMFNWSLIFIVSGYTSDYPHAEFAQMLPVFIQILWIALVAFAGAKLISHLTGAIMLKNQNTKTHKLKNHVVICNWNKQGQRLLELLKSDHIPLSSRERDIVILGIDEPDSNNLDGCHFLSNPPWEKTGHIKACTHQADSVLILSPELNDKDKEDGVIMRTALAVKSYLDENQDKRRNNINIIAEFSNPDAQKHLLELGVHEVVISRDIGMSLLAQTVTCPGITFFFDEVLNAKDDSNEIYIINMPEYLIRNAKSFVQVTRFCAINSTGNNPVLPLGYIRGKDDHAFVNPADIIDSKEASLLFMDGDRLVVLADTIEDAQKIMKGK
jgi:TRAP-type uncharacterized transport system substrate-binding protein